MKEIHAALEIGTSRTVMAIAETDNNGQLKITCKAAIPSSGIRKSQILNLPDAVQSIRTVVKEIERIQDESGDKITLGNTLLAVSGQHIQFYPTEGSIPLDGSRITDREIEQVAMRAHESPLAKGRELLDIVEQDYSLDGLGGISSPKGMSGKMLKLRTLHIHADHDRIQDARAAAEEAHLEISEPVFAGSCAADAVLEEHERKNGSLVIDLGGGCTNITAHSDGYLVFGDVIGIGGDHITNDIAYAFQTTNAQAEALKIREASALPEQYIAENARVHIGGDSALMENRTISRRALDTVVNSRLKELFTIIREELEDEGWLHRMHTGVILTGGGANMNGIESIVEQTLGMPVRKGRPQHILGLENETSPWSYATIAGALMYSQRSCEDHSILGGIIRRFF